MAGVPEEKITAHDFVMVRAALVKHLEGANEALVWSRVHYRCADPAYAFQDAEGVAWWPASNETIGTEVGLSADQVKRATTKLEQGGFLVSTEHRRGGNYDRTKSWRAIVEGRRLDSAESPNGAGDIADMSGRNRLQEQAISPNVPISQTQKTEEDKNTVVELFEVAWKAWPRKAGKKGARAKFERLVRDKVGTAEDLVEAITTHGVAYAKWAQPQYVPHLLTWLNGERWEDDVPGPRGGRGQERQDEGLALVARLREEEGHAGLGSGSAAALGSGR